MGLVEPMLRSGCRTWLSVSITLVSVYRTLPLILQELYTGAVKCVPVQRHKRDGLGHTVQVQEQLQVCVQPGVKQGTRITLPG